MRLLRCVHPPGRVRIETGPGWVRHICEECLRHRLVEWSDAQNKWLEVKSWDQVRYERTD